MTDRAGLARALFPLGTLPFIISHGMGACLFWLYVPAVGSALGAACFALAYTLAS